MRVPLSSSAALGGNDRGRRREHDTHTLEQKGGQHHVGLRFWIAKADLVGDEPWVEAFADKICVFVLERGCDVILTGKP